MRLDNITGCGVTATHARIETTLGDLICAIADAAEEAHIDERDLPRLTQLVLLNVLSRAEH